ncbi:TPA: N-acetylgalactosamine 6-sulfate sulfatase [Candidatus Poribacteria bacterium]|nr:N-acetylgalactosamine 6-sulfate sulfatase [Candidatus Poribacteria bacterium]
MSKNSTEKTAGSVSGRPNIVVILADDHGYGDLSSYGGPNLHTPNLDQLVSEGIKFTQFYANSPVCSPSRAALMTGRYPDLVGVPGVIRTHASQNWGYLSQDAVTLPDMLKEAGYYNAIIGKWHLGLEQENHPCCRGFDYFRGFLGDMMDDYYTHLRHNYNYMRFNSDEISPEGHATDLFTQWAINLIQDRKEVDQPFFLYLAYNAPHTPIQPPNDWIQKVRQREPDVSPDRAKYIALVEHMDAGIGRVIKELKDSGMYSNTLIFYTSDNGGALPVGAYNGPLRGGKEDMYEGGIRVPACAVWPEHIFPGSVTDQIALLMDLFPTICDVAGVKINHPIEGKSFLPTLLGQHQELNDRLLYWVRREGGTGDHSPMLGLGYHAVRQGDMKLLHNRPLDPLQLFNLIDDPKEQNNLSSINQPDFQALARLMQQQIQQAGAIPWQKTP